MGEGVKSINCSVGPLTDCQSVIVSQSISPIINRWDRERVETYLVRCSSPVVSVC